MGTMIIKTKKMSAKDVKHKFHEFVDELADDCGPDMEAMAEELKAYGDEFIDVLSGETSFREGTSYRSGGGSYRNGGNYRGGRAYHREGTGGLSTGSNYRNEGSWDEREENRKKNEERLQKLDREMQELKARMRDEY